MTTLYRWWRQLDILGLSGRTPQLSRNRAIPELGIVEGQTAARMLFWHMAWHNPISGGPTTGPAIMDQPCHWIIVWDDGTDSNMDTANIDYMLANHTHDILHQGVWHWNQVWGWGPVGSLQNQAAFYSQDAAQTVEIRTSRKWRSVGAETQFPRFLSRCAQTESDGNPLQYHEKLAGAVLAQTPNAIP